MVSFSNAEIPHTQIVFRGREPEIFWIFVSRVTPKVSILGLLHFGPLFFDILTFFEMKE